MEKEKDEEKDEDDLCAICLDNLNLFKYSKLNKCGHEYHIKCLDEATVKDIKHCPLCRKKLSYEGQLNNNEKVMKSIIIGNLDNINEGDIFVWSSKDNKWIKEEE
jgi:hypothetical protein